MSAAKKVRQQSRARLFRRAGHLVHRAVAGGELRLRGHLLLRQPGPGRGAGGPGGEGAGLGRQQALHRGPARGVRHRLHLPDDEGRRDLRARVPAGHLLRPAADRQAAGRDRRAGGRGRRRPRRHRQGQRPGALRADRHGAQPQAQDHRALARVEHPQPRGRAGVRGRAQRAGHRHRQVDLQPRPQPLAHQPRGRQPGRSLARAGGGRCSSSP